MTLDKNLNLAETIENIDSPIATVNGQAILDLPKDLYIPPAAMKVFLEAFEGPLDFLLYLIRKQNLNILDIPIASVTAQYMEYIDLMQDLSIELAAEYLVMAAILAEIKSRMLLPRPEGLLDDEEDPRAELIRRLQEYERFKEAAQKLNAFPREERDLYLATIDASEIDVPKYEPNVSLDELLSAFAEVLKRVELYASHQIFISPLSVREKMTFILEALNSQERIVFSDLFILEEGRMGIVVTFLAMLELLKQGMIEFIQAAAFAPIYLKAVST